MGLSGGPVGAVLAAPAAPTYDEQLGASFTQDFLSLAYNVTAVAQTDVDGYGPAYLLNGLTPEGFWYQAGISYHWPDSNGGYDPTFGFSYEVYGANGKTIYPSGGGAGLGNFSGVVRSGDSVLLSLTFVGSTVVMQAKDWGTGASASASYSNEGSSIFVGDASSPTNGDGFFTGLMTEWYHVEAYYGNEEQVTYSNDAVALTSAWMWIDEFQGHSTAPTLFDSQTQAPVTIASSGQVYPFSADGATMYVSAYKFVTGASGASSKLTLVPANAETSPPSFNLSYTLLGEPQTLVVTPGVTVLEADPGTTITVKINPSSSALESWVFDDYTGPNATLAAGTNATYVYYEVAQQTVSYSVAGGGNPMASTPVLEYETPPDVQTSSSPVTSTIARPLGTTPAVIYAVVGTTASTNGTIQGAPGERWATSTQNWTISAPDVIPSPIQFYEQYDVSVSYSILGGGTPPKAPEFNSTAFGAPTGIQLLNNSTTGWFDVGSKYYFASSLNGSTSTERWATVLGPTPVCGPPGNACGQIVGAPNQKILGEYFHQYLVEFAVNQANGGAISSTSGIADRVSQTAAWVDAGQSLNLGATATSDWRFEGWSGTGAGAYSGTNATIDVTVTEPLSENATFYVQLVISADSGTNVAYSYGSQSATVQAGTTKTLYVPPSSNVTLRASPSLFVYSFASWKGAGLSRETKPSLAVVVDSPTAVRGTSSPDYPVVLGLALVAAAILILSISLWTRNRRRRSYGAFYP